MGSGIVERIGQLYRALRKLSPLMAEGIRSTSTWAEVKKLMKLVS